MWDETIVFENPNSKLGSGLKAPVSKLPMVFEQVGDDRLFRVIKPN